MVLDASMAVAWLLKRRDPSEVSLAAQALDEVRLSGATVPALWSFEVANAMLLAERQRLIQAADSATFLSILSLLQVVQDSVPPGKSIHSVMHLGRLHNLTAYDAGYLELALRQASALATFDRKLAEAARKSGVPVFGDPA